MARPSRVKRLQNSLALKRPLNPGLRVLAVVFLINVGTGVIAPLLSPLAVSYGASPLMIGLLYSGFNAVRFLVGPSTGRFAERHGIRRALVVSTAAYPLLGLGYFVASSVTGLLAVRLVHGAFSAMMLPMATAYLAADASRPTVRWMAAYQAVLLAAAAVGPALGGLLAVRIGTHTAFLILILLAAGALLVLRRLPDVSGQEREVTKRLAPVQKELWPLFLFAAAGAVLTIYWISFFPLAARAQGFGIAATGFLLAVLNAGAATVQVPGARFLSRAPRERWLIWLSLSVAAALIAMGLLSAPALWFAAAIVAMLAASLAGTVVTSLAADKGQRAGRVPMTMAQLGMAVSAGMIGGPLLAAAVVDGYGLAFVPPAFTAIWLVAVFWFVLDRHKTTFAAAKDVKD